MTPRKPDGRVATTQARLEDLMWMDIEGNETLSGAARRLGMSYKSLKQWLLYNGHHELLNRMRMREGVL